MFVFYFRFGTINFYNTFDYLLEVRNTNNLFIYLQQQQFAAISLEQAKNFDVTQLLAVSFYLNLVLSDIYIYNI